LTWSCGTSGMRLRSSAGTHARPVPPRSGV
jgi:hypothetical protein